MFLGIRQKLTLISALIICALLVPTPAETRELCTGNNCESFNLNPESTVRIGYSQFAPYSGTSSAGVAEGYMIDMFRLLLEPLGYTLHFIAHQNPSELLESLEAGRIDVTSPLSFNAKRESYGSFTRAVHTFSFGVFTTRGGPDLGDVKALVGRRIAASEGSQGARLLQDIEGTIVVPLDNTDALLLPLLSGEVDAIAGPVESLYLGIARAGLASRIEQTSFILSQSNAGFLVHQSQTQLLKDMNLAIADAQSRGHINALYASWFRPGTDQLSPQERTILVVAMTAAIVALIYWGWLHYGVRKRSQIASERANTLQEVLNATGATFLLADKNMRPIWWNEAYASNYPEHIPLLESGTSLKTIIAATQKEDVSVGNFRTGFPRRSAEDQVMELLSGRETLSVDVVSDGRMLKSRSVMLPSGQFGVVATDVTALAAVHRELQVSADRLEEANRNLSEFSHVAAHDLAGPLRSIRNLHRWILEDISASDLKLEDEVLENFEHIDRLIERQGALINDLLAYSASEGNSACRAFNPASRWASVIDLCDIPERFNVNTPESSPNVFADPVGFEIVMRNLISNAAKHHDSKIGSISITNEVAGDVVRFSVTDDGPGIQAQYLERIFLPFRTLKSRDHGGGTGLGLAFVKRTVERWGGDVTVRSNPAKRKTTFSFTVPMATGKSEQGNVVRLRAS